MVDDAREVRILGSDLKSEVMGEDLHPLSVTDLRLHLLLVLVLVLSCR